MPGQSFLRLNDRASLSYINNGATGPWCQNANLTSEFVGASFSSRDALCFLQDGRELDHSAKQVPHQCRNRHGQRAPKGHPPGTGDNLGAAGPGGNGAQRPEKHQ